MSTTPRNIVFWPRMKVRGRRNRAKLAARYTRRDFLNVVINNVDPASGRFEFAVVPAERATHRIAVQHETRDGYGRIVALPSPVASLPEPVGPTRPAPPPSAYPLSTRKTFTTSFKVADGVDAEKLFDLIMGRAASRDAT